MIYRFICVHGATCKYMTKITYFGDEIKGFEINTTDGYNCAHFDNGHEFKLNTWGLLGDVETITRIDLYIRDDKETGKASEISVTYYNDKIKIAVDNFPIENVIKYRIVEGVKPRTVAQFCKENFG